MRPQALALPATWIARPIALMGAVYAQSMYTQLFIVALRVPDVNRGRPKK